MKKLKAAPIPGAIKPEPLRTLTPGRLKGEAGGEPPASKKPGRSQGKDFSGADEGQTGTQKTNT